MPPPIKVVLVPHDPAWGEAARAEAARLESAIGDGLFCVHHVGSTAIPGISAKPILDLMPVVADIGRLDGARGAIEALGYDWWGEYGLPGRRYCTKTDSATGRRLIQLHCYQDGSSEIERHLAFRDYLRVRPEIARAYDQEKARCRALHPDSSHDYSDCKGAWVQATEAEALEWARSRT